MKMSKAASTENVVKNLMFSSLKCSGRLTYIKQNMVYISVSVMFQFVLFTDFDHERSISMTILLEMLSLLATDQTFINSTL